MTTDTVPDYATHGIRSHYAKQQVIYLCTDPKGPQLSFKEAAEKLKVSELCVKKWITLYQRTGFLGYLGQRQAALLCVYKKNPGITFSEIKSLMRNMGFHISSCSLKKLLKDLEPMLTNPSFTNESEDKVVENIRKLTIFKKVIAKSYKMKTDEWKNELSYALVMDHTYAEAPFSSSESSEGEKNRKAEEKLKNYKYINNTVKNKTNIVDKILNTSGTCKRPRIKKIKCHSERHKFKIALIREQVIYLCIDERGPKISCKTAAKYLKNSENLINQWISQALHIKAYIKTKHKYHCCIKVQETIIRIFKMNPGLTLLQVKFIMNHVNVYISLSKLRRQLKSLTYLLNALEYSPENKFEEIAMDEIEIDYCINILHSLIAWSYKYKKKKEEIHNEDDEKLTFKKIIELSSLKHNSNVNHFENIVVQNSDLESVERITDNLGAKKNEESQRESFNLLQTKMKERNKEKKDYNMSAINNTENSVTSALKDKTNIVEIKTEIDSEDESSNLKPEDECFQRNTIVKAKFNDMPIHVKLAVLKEQIIYLCLDLKGPKMSLSTIAFYLEQPETLIEKWIKQALFIQNAVKKMHRHHCSGPIQEAVIRLFKMNTNLTDSEATYVLQHAGIIITILKLQRHLDSLKYILENLEWPSVTEAETIPLDEKELNYCNNVLSSLVNIFLGNEQPYSYKLSEPAFKEIDSIHLKQTFATKNIKSVTEENELYKDSEVFVDIKNEPVNDVSEEIIDAAEEKINIVEDGIDTLDFVSHLPENVSEHIECTDLIQNDTKISHGCKQKLNVQCKMNPGDVANFIEIKEESPDQRLYDESITCENSNKVAEKIRLADDRTYIIEHSSEKNQSSNDDFAGKDKIAEKHFSEKRLEINANTNYVENNVYDSQKDIQIIEKGIIERDTNYDDRKESYEIGVKSRKNVSRRNFSHLNTFASIDYERRKRKHSDNEDIELWFEPIEECNEKEIQYDRETVVNKIIETEDEDCIVIKYY